MSESPSRDTAPDRPREPAQTHPERPLVRDPWAWLCLASLLPLIVHSWGAPLGEPVAEDFDSLRHLLLLRQWSFVDGGGSTAFWRPVAKQLYYGLLGPLMLSHPQLVAAFHLALLAGSALLIYRMLRRVWPGPWAAAAASFPLGMESARDLIAWPSQFVNLGCLFFSCLALHEAGRRRRATSLAALAGALLCKESAVAAVVMIPLLPGIGDRKQRMRWALGAGAVLVAWAAAYSIIRDHAGLVLPHHLESELRSPAISPAARLQWGLGLSLRALVSLPAVRTSFETAHVLSWLILVAAVVLTLALNARAREQLFRADAWVWWGVTWFLLASAALSLADPLWVPARAVVGALGIGIAVVCLAGAAHPVLLGALIVLRLAAFAVSPPPPRGISVEPPRTGAFADFTHVVRLQRLMVGIRTALHERFPALEHGSQVGQNFLPLSATYALGDDEALQVWYRDTTLRWVTFEEFRRDTALRLQTIVQFQPQGDTPIALVDPAAMRAMLRGNDRIERAEWPAALADFAAADSLQTDPRARIFSGTVAAHRARCLFELGDRRRAVSEAHRALAFSPFYVDARLVLAMDAFHGGRLAEAEARLDTLLRVVPGDTIDTRLLEQVRRAEARADSSH